jgi:hypothetical protein
MQGTELKTWHILLLIKLVQLQSPFVSIGFAARRDGTARCDLVSSSRVHLYVYIGGEGC